MCSEQMSQSTCHGQTRTLPFAARAYVGTFEETYGWKEPARRPSKAPWGARGARGGARGAKRQEAPRGMGAHGIGRGEARGRHPLAHAQFPQSSARRVRTGEERCGAVRCGAVRCGAVRRVRGESGRPIRVELHSLFTPRCDIIVADDYHGSINWRRRAKHWAGRAAGVRAVWRVQGRWLSDIEISTPDSARVHWPRENNADLTSSSALAWLKGAHAWHAW